MDLLDSEALAHGLGLEPNQFLPCWGWLTEPLK